MKIFISIILSVCILSVCAQNDEFDRVYEKSCFTINSRQSISVGDTIPDDFFDESKKLNASVKGIQYPNLYLPFLQKDSIYLYSLKADITILNFNYFYCDNCVKKLDEYVSYKLNSKKTVCIISIFTDDISDISTLLPKYGKEVSFISNFKNKPKYFMLNNGTPTTFVLDKHKNIIELLTFENQTIKTN